MSEFKQYQKNQIAELRPYVDGENMASISVSIEDEKAGSPKVGDMIARNPKNHADQWLVAEQYFKDNFGELNIGGKTYGNTDVNGARKNVKDIVVFGDGDLFKLISKASSKNEKWMKSTKAMRIEGVGCLVQVTTQQGDNVSEALQFVPGVCIEDDCNNNGVVIGRRIVKDPNMQIATVEASLGRFDSSNQ